MHGSIETPDSPPAPIEGTAPQVDFQLPQLLPQPSKSFGFGGTIAVHIGVAALLLFIDSLPAPVPPPTEISIGVRNVTPLVAPPPTHPLTLPELLAQNTPQPKGTPTPTPKPVVPKFTAPAPRPTPSAPALIAEPPPLPTNTQPVPQETLFPRNTPALAPPVIEQTEQQPKAVPQEQPKLAFETPAGQLAAGKAPGGKIPLPPRTGIDELGRAMSRPSSGGGLTVGDTIDAGTSGGITSQSATVRNQSAVQMLTTDTMGVDFKPYLVTVLASVRRNWLAILPESARMGRKGRVQVQFAISRDGSVPKLVISSGSGAEALDRAAVAGISASNPFPPLPNEFQGPQIRLQFTFAYNMQ